MAHKPDLKLPQHSHCAVCGSCLNTGLIHRCMTRIRPDILEVFLMDQSPKTDRTIRTTEPTAPFSNSELSDDL